MKRLLKWTLIPIRNLSRPIRARVEARLDFIVKKSIHEALSAEIVVVMDNLVTEVYRLQNRVDELTRAVEEREAASEWNETATR